MGYPKLTPITADGTTKPRYLGDRFADFVSVKDFGAKGDGTADDTAAIQAALASAAKQVFFPAGTYVVNNEDETSDSFLFTNSVSDRVIFGHGTISVGNRVKNLLRITGNNVVVDGIAVDGDGNVAEAIYTEGDNTTIKNCHIFDIDGGDDSYGIAIYCKISSQQSFVVIENNKIENVTGSYGYNRAIVIYGADNTAGLSVVSGNIIRGVSGTEGDAIVVQGGSVADTKEIPTVIRGNTIDSWSRRGIKIAANNISIIGNRLSCNLNASLASLMGAIDATSGSNIEISNNVLHDCDYQRQIGVALESTSPGSMVVVSGNFICGQHAPSSASLMYFTYITNLSVCNNVVNYPSHEANAISCGYITGLCVANNNARVGTYSWLNIANTCTGVDTNQKTGTDFECTVPLSGRSLTFYNTDSALTDGETVFQLRCKQNDNDNPETVASSIKFVASGTSGSVGIQFLTGTSDVARFEISGPGSLLPCSDNTYTIGTGSKRIKQLYAGTATINTSDERQKQDVADIDERVLRAWGAVRFQAFKFLDAVAEKGESARIHVGIIAQQVAAAFKNEGVDASRYGLFCYDEWDDEFETVEVIDREAVYNEFGDLVSKEEKHNEKRLKTKAGNAYGIRYEEALALECAYQRWRLDLLEERINQIINS